MGRSLRARALTCLAIVWSWTGPALAAGERQTPEESRGESSVQETPSYASAIEPERVAAPAAPAARFSPGVEPSAERPVHAVWVESVGNQTRSRQGCVDLVARLREVHVDDVFLEVYSLGEASYRSDLAPSALAANEDFRDPLRAALDLAHKPGPQPLRVHVVLNLFRLSAGRRAFPLPSEHLLEKRPTWLSRDARGNERDEKGAAFLDPGAPAVQEYAIALVRELVSRYPVDGVHFAEFHYPDRTAQWGYNPLALQQFQRDCNSTVAAPDPNDPDWTSWRSAQLTGLLGALARVAREERPGTIISVSAVATGKVPGEGEGETRPIFQQALQSWPQWAAEGLVDWIVLSDLPFDRAEAEGFARWIDFGRAAKGSSKMIVAVSGPDNLDSEVVMQMRIALGREADGILLHSYQRPAANFAPDSDFLGYLGRTVFSPSYVLPPYVHQAIADSLPPQTGTSPGLSAAPDLPPPVKLDAAKPEPPPRPITQADVARALLGQGNGLRRADGDTVSAKRTAGKGETGAAPGARDASQTRGPGAQAPPSPPLGVEWVRVTLVNGTQFVAERAGGNGDPAKIRRRGSGRTLISVKRSQIKSIEPLGEDNEEAQQTGKPDATSP